MQINPRPVLLSILLILFNYNTSAQTVEKDSIKLNYSKIYSYCLNGDIKPALLLLKTDSAGKLSEKDLKFKTNFENRFQYTEDRSSFLSERKSPIDTLLKIYRDYWRLSLLDNSKHFDSLLIQNLISFFKTNQNINFKLTQSIDENRLDSCISNYIQSMGLFTTGFSKTGKYFDLLVWKTKKDTAYNFSLHHEKTRSTVVFMDDFITLGWEEYATLGRYYPGGWATKEALFCVKKAYNLKSETFLISYLAHESRHFADYKLFPMLSNADLEYRAKLTELSMAKETLWNIIASFISNSNYESENGHQIANYCVIRDLSQQLFHTESEKDINSWKKKSIKQINRASYKALKFNTRTLQKKGSNVNSYIKTHKPGP